MGQPFVGEIRIFAGSFAPNGWMFCSGQLLPIAQNETLFQLIGTTYGGDGESTFALPDLQGRVPVHQGQGPGLSERFIGEAGGSETVSLLASEMPAHTHALAASAAAAYARGPSQELVANQNGGVNSYAPAAASPPALLAASAIGVSGGGQPHNNLAPYLVVNYCIALQGIYPQRP